MLQEFWEAKKHLIQLVGILCGVGALFLSIPLPENNEAKEALYHIQFVWLVIVTLSISVLFIQFIRLSDKWEKNLRDKKGFDITDTVSLLITGTLIYLLLNLWTFFLNIYENSFWDFFNVNSVPITSLLGALYFHYWRKIALKISETSLYKKIFFSLISHIFAGLVLSFFIELSIKGTNFSFYDWGKLSIFIIIIIFILMIMETIRLWKPHISKT